MIAPGTEATLDDLQYIITIGFSGTDISRAVFLSFVAAMYTSPKHTVWTMAFFALVVDRLLWPLAGQALAGADLHTLYASIGAYGKTFSSDLGIYLVRYLGIAAMTGFFALIRRRIHGSFRKSEEG